MSTSIKILNGKAASTILEAVPSFYENITQIIGEYTPSYFELDLVNKLLFLLDFEGKSSKSLSEIAGFSKFPFNTDLLIEFLKNKSKELRDNYGLILDEKQLSEDSEKSHERSQEEVNTFGDFIEKYPIASYDIRKIEFRGILKWEQYYIDKSHEMKISNI